MIGKNVVELALTPQFSRLHPVFNVSLLMPFVSQGPSEAVEPNITGRDFVTDFLDWATTEYIMDYRCQSTDIHEYLIRDHGASVLDDEWKLLTTLSPHCDQFLRRFHETTPSRGNGPPLSVWQQRADSLV